MRTTLTLDEDAYRSALTLSQISGTPLGKVVSQLIRKGLQASVFTAGTATFPVAAGTEMIPGNRSRDLLDEEA
jgi:hypothetical protein